MWKKTPVSHLDKLSAITLKKKNQAQMGQTNKLPKNKEDPGSRI